mgnify:CR=1 FL=1
MTKKYYLNYLATYLIFLSGHLIFAQSTEVFDGEAGKSTIFTDGGQTFNIVSAEGYDVFLHGTVNGIGPGTDNCIGCGWNGTGADQQFVDNTGNGNYDGDNNGSSFSIVPVGIEMTVQSLYLFCSTRSLAVTTGTLTITGNKGGVEVFSFSKSSGFASPVTFSPNNGFTFIDFATEGASDFSILGIDELVISSTGNLDYMALDAFSWTLNILSNDDKELNKISIFPNPSSDFINIANLDTSKKYNVYSITGRLIKQGIVSKTKPINIQNISKGMYFLQLENSNKSHKFIKN